MLELPWRDVEEGIQKLELITTGKLHTHPP